MNVEERVEDALNRLERIREARDLSQNKFSDKLGVSRQTYSNWVKGRHRPDLEGWIKIQDFLGGKG